MEKFTSKNLIFTQEVHKALHDTYQEIKHTYQETFAPIENAIKQDPNCGLLAASKEDIESFKEDVCKIHKSLDEIYGILYNINPK